MNPKRLAALGRKDELLPLKSLGFTLYECRNLEEAVSIMNELRREGCDLVIITENIIEANQNKFLECLRNIPVVILVLPQYKIKRNLVKETINRIMKEAIGL